MKHLQEGITSEVYTITSKISVKDLVERLIEVKCNAACKWIDSLKVNIENSVIIGAYLTGAGLSKRLLKTSDVILVDIYPHLGNLVDMDVKFCSEIGIIKGADLVVDTTGLGGLSPEMAGHITGKIFLAEDPTSDGSDALILGKNNITDRIKRSTAEYKGILMTKGLNTKTSGTMTLTMEILRNSLKDALNMPGVLYGVAGMEFYEGVLFKEENVDKFLKLLKKPALTISTLKPFSCDEIIEGYLEKLDSQVVDVK